MCEGRGGGGTEREEKGGEARVREGLGDEGTWEWYCRRQGVQYFEERAGFYTKGDSSTSFIEKITFRSLAASWVIEAIAHWFSVLTWPVFICVSHRVEGPVKKVHLDKKT